MRKFIILLAGMICFAALYMGCANTEKTTLPTENFPEDKSTGQMNPAIITTKYPTEDIVVADVDVVRDGYAVDPSGKSNSTAGIQKALNDVAAAGGGTVWLPAGTYVITDTIRIPAYVTLRGDWQDPDISNEYGTIISVWNESKSEYAKKLVAEGIFMLGGSGGVVGLTIYYPHQSIANVKPYPYTFYTDGIGDNYMLSTIKNVTVINGYRGIGACCAGDVAHEQLTVENVKGTFLNCGAEVYNQADVGTWQNVSISPCYWENALLSPEIAKLAQVDLPTSDEIAAYVKTNAVGLKLGDLEWTEMSSLMVDGCMTGIEIIKGWRIQFAGSLYDAKIINCGKGLVVNDLDSRWGMLVAHSIIENGVYNNTYGLVKFYDVEVTGDISGNISSQISDEDLSVYPIATTKSYQKPISNFIVCDVPTGGEASGIIQNALDEMGKLGGGVVYIPAGVYCLDAPLTVPTGVELRGSSSVATRDQAFSCGGTLFLAYYGDDETANSDVQALITLSGDYAGLNGIRIIYPENGVYDENLNSTYTVRGRGKGVYIVNTMISGSAYGVDFRDCDEHFIKKVMTCCYYNAFLLGGKDGVLSGCLQNGTVLCRTAVNLENWLPEEMLFEDFFPMSRQTVDYIIIDGATNQSIFHAFIFGGCNMLINRNSENTKVVNIGADNAGGTQIVMESGSMVVINAMRYSGTSYQYEAGNLKIFNRIAINDKNEPTVKEH